jgi:hypothetical protein
MKSRAFGQRAVLVGRRAAPLLVLVALTGWSTDAASASAANAPLTPDRLTVIVKAYSRAMDQANRTLDVALQNEHETGTAARIDDNTFATDTQQRLTTDDGTTYFTARNELVREVIPAAAPQRVALAVTRTVYAASTPGVDACRGGGSLLVFKRSSSRAPWKVGLGPSVELRRVPPLATTSGGYGSLVTSGRALRTTPSRLPAAFARQLSTELNAYAASRSVAGLPAYLFGTEDCFGLFNPPNLVEGFSYRFSVEPVSPSDLVAFRTANGGALVTFSVETETEMAVTTTTAANQPSQPATSEQVAGRGLIEVAAVVPPAGSRHAKPYTVIGGYSGDIAPGTTQSG